MLNSESKPKKKKTAVIAVIAAIVVVVIALVIIISGSNKSKNYMIARELWLQGDKQAAVVIWQDMYSYKDSGEYVDEFKNNIVQQLSQGKWTTEFLSDNNGYGTKWEGYYFLEFDPDGTCIFSWDGQYSGERDNKSQDQAEKTYEISVSESAIKLTVNDDEGVIRMDGDELKDFSLTFAVYYNEESHNFTRM